MRRIHFALCWSVCVVASYSLSLAQQASTTGSTIIVPHLIRFAGMLKDPSGHPLTGIAGVTFSLYREQEGGAPVWLETQNVAPDANGRYEVLLGAESSAGVPMEVFTSGEARWLGVQAQGQGAEQPRVLLVSVPYALKAADASTLNGLPASAFMLAPTPTAPSAATVASDSTVAAQSGSAPPPPAPCSSITSDGSAQVNQISKFTAPCNIKASKITDNGNKVSVPELLNLPSKGTATANAGQTSQALNWTASAFNSGTAAAVSQNFRWQAEPTGNNTTTPSGTLNLLFGQGTTTPAETGFRIASNGQLTFVPGQIFPGTGSGTVSNVGLSAPASDFTVSGSPVTSSGTLNLAWNVAPTNASTANAIVKRDASGSFNATNLNASGQITVDSSGSLSPILAIARSVTAAAIVGSATATGATYTYGVEGSTLSSGTGSTGLIGLDHNSAPAVGNYTAGVTGRTFSSYGVGVLGLGTWSNNGQSNVGFSRVGVWGDDASGLGVAASSDSGSALAAFNSSADSPTLRAINDSSNNAVFAFNTSTTNPTMYVDNNTNSPTGVIFRAEAPQVQVNGSTAFCQVNTRGGMGCTGDFYQNTPANGLVKALLYFDPSQAVGHQIVNCFNMALAEPAASTPPCGMSIIHLGAGDNRIDFGFPIRNRFVQVTTLLVLSDSHPVIANLGTFSPANTQIDVATFYANTNPDISITFSPTDTPFYLTVF